MVIRGERVEDGTKDGESQATTVGGRRGDWGAEVLAYLGEEHGKVGRLANEVDQQVVGCYEL